MVRRLREGEIMSAAELRQAVDAAWEGRDSINSKTKGVVRDAIEAAIAGLDDGTYRTAEKLGGEWVVNQWLKKAVLLSFRLYDSVPMDGGAMFPGIGAAPWYDKVPLKTSGWDAARFGKAGFRAVPGSVVRRGSFVAPSVVLMPSFVNLGAYVDSGTMVDTWATVGSCAQIGKNCHLSGGVGIGGVLEPLQANPVIVEDNCFIGARSEVVEGVIVETGAVLAMGVFISATTKIVDRATGQIHTGRVPAYSVVVPGNLPGGPDRPSTYCAVIVKTVDERTRAKTSINELLRD
jgi:2,3,4,5-tetrahydropyridine-2-carboxylate N-succinyltransferase